jgi:hypothetical protein
MCRACVIGLLTNFKLLQAADMHCPMQMTFTVVLFMNGVTGEPFNYFPRLVSLQLTGAAVKNLIAAVDHRSGQCK